MSAVLSDDRLLRFRLDRTVATGGPTYAFFGINPSTADEDVDDATVRKWIGFTKVLGGRGFIVGNVFPYRTKDVKKLVDTPEEATSLNHAYLRVIAHEADILIPCWGNTTKVSKTLEDSFYDVVNVLQSTGKPMWTFGYTKSGDPLHPLMLGYDTALQPWIYQ